MGGTFAEWILCEPLLYQGIPSVKGMKKQAGLEIEMSLELMEICHCQESIPWYSGISVSHKVMIARGSTTVITIVIGTQGS